MENIKKFTPAEVPPEVVDAALLNIEEGGVNEGARLQEELLETQLAMRGLPEAYEASVNLGAAITDPEAKKVETEKGRKLYDQLKELRATEERLNAEIERKIRSGGMKRGQYGLQ